MGTEQQWPGSRQARVISVYTAFHRKQRSSPSKFVSEFQVPYCSEYDNFGPCALAWNDDILSGLEYVLWLHNNTSINIAAVNLSLGEGYYPSACDDEFPFIKAAVDNLRSVGIATIAAVGDDRYSDGVNAPACISSVISAGYESYMANIGADLYAPGELDIVPEPENDFSMARGHICIYCTCFWSMGKYAPALSGGLGNGNIGFVRR